MSEAPAMTDLGAGDPWVLVHSFPVDRRMWEAQCAALAAADSPEARAGRVLNLALVRGKGTSALIEKMLPHLLHREAPESVRDALRGWAAEQSPEGVCDALLAMRDRGDATAVLGSIVCPTLLLVGSHDTITPPAEHAAMAAAIAGSRMEVIEGAGHLSNLERPEAFDAALRRWAASALT